MTPNLRRPGWMCGLILLVFYRYGLWVAVQFTVGVLSALLMGLKRELGVA